MVEEEQGGLSLPPPQPLNTMAPALETGEAEKGIVPNRWGTLRALINQASDKGAVGLPGFDPGYATRALVQSQMESQDSASGLPKISPDEANKRYPDMPVPFNAPVDPRVADIQYSDFKHRQKLADWVSRGDASPWVSVPVGIAATTLDPMNIALMTLAGPVTGAMGLTSSLRNTFLTNLAINEATGVPGYFAEKAEHQKTSFPEAEAEMVGGALGGTALHYGASALYGKLISPMLNKAMEFIKRTPEDIQTNNLKTAVNQHETGSAVNITPGVAETAARLNGDMEGTQSPFRYSPVGHPSETSYYMAKSSQGHDVQFGSLGDGIHAVDNPAIANNMVSNPGSDSQGHVGEYTPKPGTKFLDLESPVDTPENEKFLKEVSEATGIKIEPQEGETLKSILSEIDQMGARPEVASNVLNQAQEVAKSQGYEGFRYIERDPMTGDPKHNGIVMFDPETKPQAQFNANPAITPQMSAEQRAAFNDQSTGQAASATYTPELDKQIRDFRHGHPLNSDPEYMDPIVQEQLQAAEAYLEKQAKIDPSLKEDLQQLKQMAATHAQEKQTLSDYIECVEESMS